MKKIISLVCLLSIMVLSFASCGQHDHEFEDKWTTDSDYHWHACVADENCKEKGDRELHDFAVDLDEDGNTVNACKVCGYENDRVSTAPEHEHTFGTEYAYSDNFHWFECTVEGCYETSKSRDHQYSTPETSYADGKLTVKYTCVDCGYEKVEVTTVDVQVDSATEWDELFGSFKLTNFSMDVYIGYEGEIQHNHCVVTEDALYYHIPDSIEMYIVKEDGVWAGYRKSEYEDDAKYEIIEGTQEELQQMCENYSRETILQISFAENFEKFTYNAEEGTYTSNQTIDATYYDNDGDIAGTLYCLNSTVKVADGKIIYISADYNFGREHDDGTYRFVYDHIGIADMSVPQSVIDEANENAANDNSENEEQNSQNPMN